MPVLARHHVQRLGQGPVPLVFVNGFGCDQNVWRHLVAAFAGTHELLLYDEIGAGRADRAAYDRQKYASLDGHADDLIAICEAAGVQRPVLIAHSVGTMIGIVAARRRPDLFRGLALVAPNPCYLNDGEYVGGFTREDIDDLLDLLDSNYFSWARMMAPVIMGNADRPELGAELANNFCSTDPVIGRDFAHVTFLADHRADLPFVQAPCCILQCSDDALAPPAVGHYMAQRLPDARLRTLAAVGHCPHLSAPGETIDVIRGFLDGLAAPGAA